MDAGPQWMLVGAVAAVGVLHTIVPDHWVPITMLARDRAWTTRETAGAALRAGAGHALSTLAIAIAVWLAGAAFAQRFGAVVDDAASLALVLFGGWIAIAAWREQNGLHRHRHHAHAAAASHTHHRHHDDDEAHAEPPHTHHEHGHAHADAHAHHDDDGDTMVLGHLHTHRHGGAGFHSHWHDHDVATAHGVSAALALTPPLHEHAHPTSARTALLLILGSSPMIEGIPAFFAAAKYGAGLLAVMAVVFALATIATYVALCVLSARGLQQARLGPLERYGEVLSGALIAAVGVAFWLWPVL